MRALTLTPTLTLTVVVHLDRAVQLLVGEVELAWLGLGLGFG